MKIKSFLRIIQGHQITDEEIYQSRGEIPILTGKNEIKGYWDKQLIEKEDLPCITYPSKANSGEAYVQTQLFDANNTAVLIPFSEWRNKINLYWLCLKLSNLFLTDMTSKAGVSYLNKDIVEDIEIDIPNKKIQDEEYRKIQYLLDLKEKISIIIKKIERIRTSQTTIQYTTYQAKEIPITKILRCVSGNSGLTEEYIYSLLLDKRERKYKVLTGSIDVQSVQMISQCTKPHNSNKLINIFIGEGIHIVRNGKAGFCTHLPTDHYTLNDHAYILTLRKDCPYKISLKWIVNTQPKLFLQYATQSDNGTWNMTGFFEEVTIDLPSYEEQCSIDKKFDQLREYEQQARNIYSKVANVLLRELI